MIRDRVENLRVIGRGIIILWAVGNVGLFAILSWLRVLPLTQEGMAVAILLGFAATLCFLTWRVAACSVRLAGKTLVVSNPFRKRVVLVDDVVVIGLAWPRIFSPPPVAGLVIRTRKGRRILPLHAVSVDRLNALGHLLPGVPTDIERDLRSYVNEK